jgi:hypothetical protein
VCSRSLPVFVLVFLSLLQILERNTLKGGRLDLAQSFRSFSPRMPSLSACGEAEHDGGRITCVTEQAVHLTPRRERALTGMG